MKKSSEALKQEPVSMNMAQKPKAKLHIQKVQPAKGTTVVADPGGCRPTGT